MPRGEVRACLGCGDEDVPGAVRVSLLRGGEPGDCRGTRCAGAIRVLRPFAAASAPRRFAGGCRPRYRRARRTRVRKYAQGADTFPPLSRRSAHGFGRAPDRGGAVCGVRGPGGGAFYRIARTCRRFRQSVRCRASEVRRAVRCGVRCHRVGTEKLDRYDSRESGQYAFPERRRFASVPSGRSRSVD